MNPSNTTIHAQNIDREILICKHSNDLCTNTHQCHTCPYQPHLRETQILGGHIDANTYDYFIENAYILAGQNHKQYGYFLTEALKLYLQTAEQYNLDPLIKNINKNITIITQIIVDNIHPQIHQKFKKYLQKKYKTKNITKHYNRELNTALAIYVNCIQIPQIQKNIEFAYNLQELNTLYQECNTKEEDNYELF